MIRPVKIVPLSNYKIRVTYSDGATGILDLSDIAGRGIFAPLKDEVFFQTVYVGDRGQIAWSEELEICPDAAYMEITGKKSEEAIHA